MSGTSFWGPGPGTISWDLVCDTVAHLRSDGLKFQHWAGLDVIGPRLSPIWEAAPGSWPMGSRKSSGCLITLGFGGENKVKYADVVSGGDGMTMVVWISGGTCAHLLPPMMIFSNDARSYPIRGVSDDVDGVCYRTGPKGWMDKRLFREYLCEPRAQRPDRLGRKKHIFLDNCSGHLNEDECAEELEKLNASLMFFPPNATDLCQPADSFVIAKIKDEWRRLWNEKKIELIESNAWQNKVRSDGAWSGKLKNPGKRYFLSLAAKAVRRVNAQRDNNGLNYARKAMIRCGLSLDVDGKWRVEQLFSHLQEIIRKYPVEFAGKSVGSVSSSGEVNDSAPPTTTEAVV